MATNSKPVSVKSTPANTYQIGVSTTPSTRKPQGKEIAALRFRPTHATKDELVKFIRGGHTLCHNFGHAEGEVFTIKDKNLKRFTHADMVMIDVDDSVVDMQTLTDSLTLPPSIAFTTYSNGVKGYRFRLIYLFSEHLGAEDYHNAYKAIKQQNGLDLSDDCMNSFAQCSFTNGSGSVEVITSDEVYSLGRLGVVGGGQMRHSETIKENNTDSSLALTAVFDHTSSNGIIADLTAMNWSDFVIERRGIYGPIIEHTPLEYNEDGYALLDNSYIEIYRRWYLDCYEVNGEERRTPRLKRLRDGEKRHYKLWLTCVLRRRIKPTITFEQLLYNTVGEVVYHYDNSDKRFGVASLVDMCKRVMSMSDDELNKLQAMKDRRGYRIDPVRFANKEERRHARRAVKRIITDKEIERLYDNSRCDKENLAILAENGIRISRQRLTQYKSDHGIKSQTKSEQIGNLYDPHLSDRENLAVFNENGLTISLRTLKKWRADNGIVRRCKIDNSETIKKNTTQSSLALSCQNCTSVESQENHTTTETASIVDEAIKEVESRCKPGYRKQYPTLQDYLKPLGDIIKDIPTIEDVMRARECFDQLVATLQYNAFSDRFTITAYNRLFDSRIEALRAA